VAAAQLPPAGCRRPAAAGHAAVGHAAAAGLLPPLAAGRLPPAGCRWPADGRRPPAGCRWPTASRPHGPNSAFSNKCNAVSKKVQRIS